MLKKLITLNIISHVTKFQIGGVEFISIVSYFKYYNRYYSLKICQSRGLGYKTVCHIIFSILLSNVFTTFN